MDEPTELGSAVPAERWGHVRWLLVLLVLAAGLRVWQVSHTEVTTRDSIAFIRYAWRLQSENWLDVIRTADHHPVYPILVHLASGPLRAVAGDDLPRTMQLATQLVSSLASVLLVIPAYFLGCLLFNRLVGFWATLLFQCLPASGRVMSDGLTDPVFLLLAAAALLFACRAVRAGGAGWFVLTGLAGGLAYLTRTEGLLIPAVTGMVLLGLQLSRTWRRDWRGLARAGLALTAATLVVAGPFMYHIGGVSLKPSQHLFLGGKWQTRSPSAAQARVGDEPVGLNSAGLPLAVWLYKFDVGPEDRYFWAARALVMMVDKGFFHVLTLPFLAGAIFLHRRMARVPGLWVLFVLGSVLAALLYRLGQSNGYVGERHVLLIVMGGLYWAVAALDGLCGFLSRRLGRVPGRVLALGLFVGLALLPLPKTLAPLHAERAGFRQAGQWLAEHLQPGDRVVDPFTWSSYHAGLDFQHPGVKARVVHESERKRDRRPVPPTSACYVVLDRSRSKHEHIWYLVRPAEELASQGAVVQSFPVHAGKYRGTVVVYRVRLAAGQPPGRLVLSECE